mgnify:CR=1 FL=1
MKKIIILIPFILSLLSGCSYVTDSIEAAITERASFSASATYNAGPPASVTITWDESDMTSDFAGYEIYRTKYPNDEYSEYELVANRYDAGHALDNGATNSFTDNFSLYPLNGSGTYFYRIGVIYWDEAPEDRTNENGYSPEYPNAGWDGETNYNANTNLESISGYARVVIP